MSQKRNAPAFFSLYCVVLFFMVLLGIRGLALFGQDTGQTVYDWPHSCQYEFGAEGSALVLGDVGTTALSPSFSAEWGPIGLYLAPFVTVDTGSKPVFSPGIAELSLSLGSLAFKGGCFSDPVSGGRFTALGSRIRQKTVMASAFGSSGLADSADWRAEITGSLRDWNISASVSSLTSAGTYADSPAYGTVYFPNSLLVDDIINPVFGTVLTRGAVLWVNPSIDDYALYPSLTLEAESRVFSAWLYNGAALDGPTISRLLMPSDDTLEQYFAPVYARVNEAGLVYSLRRDGYEARAGAVYTYGLPVVSGSVTAVENWGDWQNWAPSERLVLYSSAEFELWRMNVGGEWKHSIHFNLPDAAQYPWLGQSVACWVSGDLGLGKPTPEISILRSLQDGSSVFRLGITYPDTGLRSVTFCWLYVMGSASTELGQYGSNSWGVSCLAVW